MLRSQGHGPKLGKDNKIHRVLCLKMFSIESYRKLPLVIIASFQIKENSPKIPQKSVSSACP